MAKNIIHRATLGATGRVVSFTIYGEDGLPLPLTGYTVKLSVLTKSDVAIMDEVDCAIDADQTVNPGRGSLTYDCTVAAFPNMVKGDHKLRFTVIDPAGKKDYMPRLDYAQFGIFRVLG